MTMRSSLVLLAAYVSFGVAVSAAAADDHGCMHNAVAGL